ncbi:MAG: T9SS type A sorting domain-containing protein [Rhodothermales bacterium]|nr:T9SS type A sorting domain-containing protein [Rhodothermales bacterium]
MRAACLSIALLLATAGWEVAAQPVAPDSWGLAPSRTTDHVHPGLRHNAPYCGTLLEAPEFREAYERWVAKGLTRGANEGSNVAAKSASPPDVGDRQNFFVYIYATGNFVEREFELRDKTDLYHAWVAVADLAQLSDSELEAIRRAMISETPQGSVDPGLGVMANNHAVFGSPPNVDGDGIVDFLFYDIDNQNVGGFVHPGDLDRDSGGNGRDILHLDVLQSVSFLPRLIAHEYTHLIHFNYEFDVETFISEGLAEFAMVANGYTQDNFSYLGFPTEHKRPLFSWRGVDDQNGGRDYDRGRLFFSYVAERVGPFSTGEMVRNDRKGAPGIDSILVREGVGLGEVIEDFHTANWVFDTDVAAEYGYTRNFSVPLAPIPDEYIDTTQGSSTPEPDPEDSPTLEGGAVNYIYFTDLADLTLNFDAYAAPAVVAITPSILDDFRSRLRGRVIATRDDGTVESVEVLPSAGNHLIQGNFTDVVFIVTSVDPSKTTRYQMAAGWRDFGTSLDVESGAVPESFAIGGIYPNPASTHSTLRLEMETPAVASLSLFDPLGRRLQHTTTGLLASGRHELPVQLDGIPSGAYLLVVEVANRRITRPVTVVR